MDQRKAILRSIDCNKDGKVSKDEAMHILQQHGISSQDALTQFDKAHIDDNGYLRWHETESIVNALASKLKPINPA
ncbi:hypothetical protein BDW59DRAFT_145915, partial [Aspergillus cavernicola]